MNTRQAKAAPQSSVSTTVSAEQSGAISANAAGQSSFRATPALNATTRDAIIGDWSTLSSGTTTDETMAQKGMSGASSALPHREKLETSFGRDLGHIKSFQGGDAKQASDELGASAYAYQGNVVLGGSTDLHTVAEETAHALQYQNTTSARGLTQPGDAVENEATGAADAVVAGRSVGALSQGVGQSIARSATSGGRTDQQNYRRSQSEELLENSGLDSEMLNTVRQSAHLKAGALDDKQKLAHLMAQYEIFKTRILNKPAKSTLIFVKFIDKSRVGKILGGVETAIGGSIGHEETTTHTNGETMSADETTRTLGLDYKGSSFTRGRDNKTSAKAVHLLKLNVTKEEAVEKMGVSLAPQMIDMIDKLKNSTDPQVKAMANNIGAKIFPWYEEAKRNPFRGTGITGTGSSMKGLDGINQELSTGREKVTIGPGSQLLERTDRGGDRLLATLQAGGDWQYSAQVGKTEQTSFNRSAGGHRAAATRRANAGSTS